VIAWRVGARIAFVFWTIE